MADRKLSLGLFMPNCSNMPSISTAHVIPDQWTFEYNRQLALDAESAGFEYLFPVSRWRGFGGETNFLGTSLETVTWATAILQATERINVFSTIHVPLFHPFVVAKMGATLAHISRNRWGLNIVSGWSQREFGMMGIELEDHHKRYERTAAFIEILRSLWCSRKQPFNHASEWYNVVEGEASPVPDIAPVIANAGSSSDGRDLTAKLCDWAFVSTPSIGEDGEVVSDIQRRAATHGRSVKTAIFPFVVMGASQRASEAALSEIIAAKDDVATKNWLTDLTSGSGSFDTFTENMLASSGGGVHVIGTPEAIASQLETAFLAGVDAVMLTFPRYREGLQAFNSSVLPLLKERGVVS